MNISKSQNELQIIVNSLYLELRNNCEQTINDLSRDLGTKKFE